MELVEEHTTLYDGTDPGYSRKESAKNTFIDDAYTMNCDIIITM